VILAVFDCNVVVSAIGWGGPPRACLELVRGRQVRLCVTSEVWAEYDLKVRAVLLREKPSIDPEPVLSWLLTEAYFVNPAPLGKQRSRDIKDDRYLACALGAGATLVVTSDRDLLDLGKPFGLAVLTPMQFLKLVRGQP